MKQKTIIITTLIITLIFNTITVYAGDWGTDQETSTQYIEYKNGEKRPYSYKIIDPDDGIEKTFYRYHLAQKGQDGVVIKEINGKKRFFRINQPSYLTTPTDNPENLEPLKNPENFKDTYDIYNNRNNFEGISYVTKSNKTYPTDYPDLPIIRRDLIGKDNYNFKTDTSNIFTKVVEQVANPTKQFFTHTTGIDGNVRWIKDHMGNTVSSIYISADYLSNPLTGYFTSLNLIKESWLKYTTRVKKGDVNKEFESRGKVVSQEYIDEYTAFTAFNQGLETSIIEQCRRNGLSATLENQVKMFYTYCSQDKRVFEGGHYVEMHGSGWRASGITPEEIYPRNLILYNLKLLDENGQEVEKAVADDTTKYKLTYDVVLESDSENDKTFNKDILSNVFINFNNNQDLSKSDIYMSDIKSTNMSNQQLQSATKTYIQGDTTKITNNDLDFPERKSSYETDYFTIPSTYNSGQIIEKLTIWAYTPWQYSHYRSLDNIYQNDNITEIDDFQKLEIPVGQLYNNDLSIPEIWVIDKETGQNVTDGKVKKGKTYIPYFKVKNISENTTKEVIEVGLSNGYESQIFNHYRDERTGYLKDTQKLTSMQDIVIEGKEFTIDKYNPTNFSIYSWISSKHDSKDNIYNFNQDVKKIDLHLEKQDIDDNAVINIQLFDLEGNEYNYKNPDGSYILDPTKTYYSLITVKKLMGNVPLQKPRLEIGYKLQQGAGIVSETLTTQNSLNSVGDEIVYKLSDLHPLNGYLNIWANLPYADVNNDNNTMWKEWIGYYNFSVVEFNIRPERVHLSEDENYREEKIGFSAKLNYSNYNPNGLGTVEDVPLYIYYQNKIIYKEENLTFRNGETINIQGTLNNGNPIPLGKGNNVFVIGINGGINGKVGNRKYHEITKTGNPYLDNEKTDYISVSKDQPPNIEKEMLECDKYNLSSSWSVNFQMFKQTGSLKSRQVTSCKNGSCSTRTITWCENVKTESWVDRRNYREEFETKVLFKSPSTIDKYGDEFINILGNNKGIVRAGQWFEVKVETNYRTDRKNMPNTYRRNKCNFQTRSPNVASLPKSPEFISLKISNFGKTEYYPRLYPTEQKGSWDNHTRTFRPPLQNGKDIFKETSVRRYLPTNAEDGTIILSIITLPFEGYGHDQEYPENTYFQDCRVAKIYVNNSLPIRTQRIGSN